MNAPVARSRPRLALLLAVLAAGTVVGGCVLAAGSTLSPGARPMAALAGLLAYILLTRRAVYLWTPDYDSVVWNAGKRERRDSGADPPWPGGRRIRRAILEELARAGRERPSPFGLPSRGGSLSERPGAPGQSGHLWRER